MEKEPRLNRGLLRSSLGFSALCSQLVKQAWLQVLYRWNERPSPGNLAEINPADLKLLHIILALSKHRTVRRYDSASTPELQTLLNTNPVNIGEVDSVLHRPAQTETLEKPPPQPRTRGDADNQFCPLQRLQTRQLRKVEIITDAQTNNPNIRLEHRRLLTWTIVSTFFENRMRWKMDLSVLSNQPLRPDKHSSIVDNTLNLALLWHAEDNMDTVFPCQGLNLPRAGTRNRLREMGDLVPHRIARQVKLRKDQKVNVLLSSLRRLFRDLPQVSFLVSQFGTGLG